MSAAAVIPPPNSSSVVRTGPRLTERARALLTAMNVHFAGVAALSVLALWLFILLFITWGDLREHDANALAQQRVKLHMAEVAEVPLRGLDAKVDKSTQQANEFYTDRLPYAWSQVLTELGTLSTKTGVRLTHATYAPVPVLQGDDALVQLGIDATVSGDYRPTVEFVNALERDQLFFVITNLSLTGQQTGQVNLRLRLKTYLRKPDADEMAQASGIPATPGQTTPSKTTPSKTTSSKATSSQATSSQATSSKTTHSKTTPGNTTPGSHDGGVQ